MEIKTHKKIQGGEFTVIKLKLTKNVQADEKGLVHRYFIE